jgi:hypothetical protein
MISLLAVVKSVQDGPRDPSEMIPLTQNSTLGYCWVGVTGRGGD